MGEESKSDGKSTVIVFVLITAIIVIVSSMLIGRVSFDVDAKGTKINTTVDNPRSEHIFIICIAVGMFLVLAAIAYSIAFRSKPERERELKKDKKQTNS